MILVSEDIRQSEALPNMAMCVHHLLSGRSPSSQRVYRAGNVDFLARSPEAPKTSSRSYHEIDKSIGKRKKDSNIIIATHRSPRHFV